MSNRSANGPLVLTGALLSRSRPSVVASVNPCAIKLQRNKNEPTADIRSDKDKNLTLCSVIKSPAMVRDISTRANLGDLRVGSKGGSVRNY